jgi:hypothetical protein
MSVTINQPQKMLTFDDLMNTLHREGWVRRWIGPVEIYGSYDQAAHAHMWQADYAMRTDDYIKNLLEKHPTPA